MATKKQPAKKADGEKRPKLSKKDPDFYSRIGRIGGRRTAKVQGKAFFSKIAALSHRDRDSSKRAPRDQPEDN